MTVLDFPGARRALRTPDELCEALGIPFSDQQLAAITAPLEPAVIIAGAGSGKTTVMAARVVWLVGTGQVRPEEVLGLTFTRKAAAELSARVRAALVRADVLNNDGVDEAGEQVVMTYDAFAARLVSEHGMRIGVDTDPVMITGATRYRLAARVVKNAAGPFEALSRLRPSSITERVLGLDSDMQSHLVSAADLDADARAYRMELLSAPPKRGGGRYKQIDDALATLDERLELAGLVTQYQRLKRELGVVEFSDQMAVAADLVGRVPVVGELLREQFRVVLLDEYQDTSSAQAELLHGLFSGERTDEGRGHPVTAVGDPFQAIYGWRGAAASNILEFSDHFRRADGGPATPYALTVNRRSGHTILEVANQLAAPLRADPLLTSDLSDQALVGPPEAPAGEVAAATFISWPEEIAWVADQIAAAKEHGEVAAWSDIAVLARRNSQIGSLFGELSARSIPVEIVGLGGLLELPEILDVVCTLRLVNDVTANPSLLRLLSGARWRIGPRDLALLGQRAAYLAGQRRDEAAESEELAAALADAVADIDPTEVISLVDALSDPGDLPYSEAARQRFAICAAELATLRSHAEEPVLDLVRRVIQALGLDVELVATPEFDASGRRTQLATFLDAVAGYVDVDGDASLSGLLAYLDAEVEHSVGLEQAVPTEANSVKLLTVHKAKGLEWQLVFLPGVVAEVFPSTRVTDNWTKNAAAVPAGLRGDRDSIPQLTEVSKVGLDAYATALKEQQTRSEDRLAYVAVTRAKRRLVASAHVWQPGLVKPKAPSPYFRVISEVARRDGRMLAEAPAPEAGAQNPLDATIEAVVWPQPLDPDAERRRRDAALAVEAARARFAQTGSYQLDDEPLMLDIAEQIAGWDDDIDRLTAELRESRRGVRAVLMPESLSATRLLQVRADPQAFAAELIRPMPQPPSAAARRGSLFHEWVEQYYARLQHTVPLFDPDTLADRADEDTPDRTELTELIDAFRAGPYAERIPDAIERAFTLRLGAQLIRGRIDAAYRLDGSDGYHWQVVDWKTNAATEADVGQLAIYRLAWAELHGLTPDQVDAVFYYVRDARLVRPTGLGGRTELESWLNDTVGL
ncbi:ATP-dependent helicase [Granulicoccus phenolivorans]|uniref:ATP-dependent helicase n=1 Tax=Granulicoccus phenolivorans TaxID=266854 RepID=UPI0003F6E682|nr:ATP-dependent DNA helicase [Granulicoccus phenolivorans]